MISSTTTLHELRAYLRERLEVRLKTWWSRLFRFGLYWIIRIWIFSPYWDFCFPGQPLTQKCPVTPKWTYNSLLPQGPVRFGYLRLSIYSVDRSVRVSQVFYFCLDLQQPCMWTLWSRLYYQSRRVVMNIIVKVIKIWQKWKLMGIFSHAIKSIT